ncbi:MAG: hypothetical protein AAB425_12645, partial [Bdellovibrionota bacterium]
QLPDDTLSLEENLSLVDQLMARSAVAGAPWIWEQAFGMRDSKYHSELVLQILGDAKYVKLHPDAIGTWLEHSTLTGELTSRLAQILAIIQQDLSLQIPAELTLLTRLLEVGSRHSLPGESAYLLPVLTKLTSNAQTRPTRQRLYGLIFKMPPTESMPDLFARVVETATSADDLEGFGTWFFDPPALWGFRPSEASDRALTAYLEKHSQIVGLPCGVPLAQRDAGCTTYLAKVCNGHALKIVSAGEIAKTLVRVISDSVQSSPLRTIKATEANLIITHLQSCRSKKVLTDLEAARLFLELRDTGQMSLIMKRYADEAFRALPVEVRRSVSPKN